MLTAPQKGNQLFRYLLYLNYLSLIFLLLSYLSIFISPLNFWAISIFGMAYPIILITNLLFVIIWLILKQRCFIISVIVILLGFNLPGKFVQLNLPNPTDKDIKTLSVLSFNVHNFSHESVTGTFNKETQEKIFSFIESQRADIVCMQEFNYVGENIYASHAQLKQRLGSDNYFFESYFNPKKNKVFGLATFSKFPIVNTGIFGLPETRKFGTFIDLLYQNDTIRLYNIHLESVSLSHEDYSFMTSISINDSVQKPNTNLLLGKLKKATLNRTKQVLVLKEHIKNSPYPVIICGDFNELPNSYNYKKLSLGLNDAFVESGFGIGKTFAGNFPAFRIDYILFDPVFHSLKYNEFKLELSDHYPINAKLYFK